MDDVEETRAPGREEWFAALLAGTLGRNPASLPVASAAPVYVTRVTNTTNAEVVV